MKYILWDFEHTLAYRDGDWTQSIVDLCKKHHVHIAYEQLHSYMTTGLPWFEFEKTHKELFRKKTWWEYTEGYMTTVLESLNVKKANAIVKEFKDFYLDPTSWHLYGDTILTMEELKNKGYTQIIATNFAPELEDLVNALGLDSYIDKVYASGNMEYEKPNIHFFRNILDELQDMERVIVVGNSYNVDIRGAKHAGVNEAILVRNPNKMRYEQSADNLGGILEYIQ